jgi:hypothetical protein
VCFGWNKALSDTFWNPFTLHQVCLASSHHGPRANCSDWLKRVDAEDSAFSIHFPSIAGTVFLRIGDADLTIVYWCAGGLPDAEQDGDELRGEALGNCTGPDKIGGWGSIGFWRNNSCLVLL